MKKMPKIVFVTGGVVSSLGKGIVASILGGLLKARGITPQIKKIDPYLNIDPGTLSPLEHGEVFVTEDGAETDLDLGHYERLAQIQTNKSDYITSGSIFNKIIKKERNGEYLGKTVQLIPHFTKELEEAILENLNCEVLICEVGGTVGDIESTAILEAIRQIKQSYSEKVISLHIAYMPYLKKAKEWKTKPVQHSIRTLLSYGIQTDMLLCRMESKADIQWKEKISLLCNLKKENIFEALDAKTIYHAMQNYEKEGICSNILKLLELPNNEADIEYLNHFVKKTDKENLPVTKVALVGKYNKCKDAYKSVEESLLHACVENNTQLKIKWIDAENYKIDELKECDAILVPGGFGERAAEGKMKAIEYAKENNVPFLGICFGLQLAIIHSLKKSLEDASSSEFGYCKNPVIAKLEEWDKDNQILIARKELGGTMRLGAYPCKLKEGTLAKKIYKKNTVYERHRHRYEVNSNYKKEIEKAGIIISGECNGLVEIIEIKDHKFFLACQYHPEFKSKINEPNPLFFEFIKSSRS